MFGASSSRSVGVQGFEAEAMVLLDRARTSTRKLERRETLVALGASGASITLIQAGWAGRIHRNAAGRRQIIDLLLPGDLCGLEALVSDDTSYTIEALTEVTVARFDAAAVRSLAAEHPSLAAAILRQSVRQSASARIGQVRLRNRNATERLADLILALSSRLNAIAGTIGDHEIPLTQFDLADATGLTSIHANRALRNLRALGLITIDRRRLRVTDLDALLLIAGGRAGE